MRFRINNCLINIRTLSDEELENLLNSTGDRLKQVSEEMETLAGEKVRRLRHLRVVP